MGRFLGDDEPALAGGDAADIVKRSADRVTATNRQDGLAQVLEEWF